VLALYAGASNVAERARCLRLLEQLRGRLGLKGRL